MSCLKNWWKSTELHRRVRWPHLVSSILLCGIIILLVTWLVKEIHNNFEEPLIGLIVLGISLLLGTQIVKELTDIRAMDKIGRAHV